jgi:hypothetical protein
VQWVPHSGSRSPTLRRKVPAGTGRKKSRHMHGSGVSPVLALWKAINQVYVFWWDLLTARLLLEATATLAPKLTMGTWDPRLSHDDARGQCPWPGSADVPTEISSLHRRASCQLWNPCHYDTPSGTDGGKAEAAAVPHLYSGPL